MQEVNLIPDVERSDQIREHRGQIIYIICGTILTLFIVFMVGLFGAYTLSVKKIHDLSVEKGPLEAAIKDKEQTEYDYQVVYQKTDQIQKILSQQPPFEKIIARLLEFTTNGISFTEVNLSAPNKVIITGKASGLATLDGFLADLTAKDFGRKTFTDIVLQSLSRDDKGTYDFSARFTYTGEH